MGDNRYASQVMKETLGLPATLFDGLDKQTPGLNHVAELLMARTRPENEDEPAVESTMQRLYGELTQDRVNSGTPWAQVWYYPEPRDFAVFLSHDVDEVTWSWRRRLLMGVTHPSSWGSKGRRYWNFDQVMALERGHGLRSSFYVVPFGDHPRDPPYSLADISRIVARMRANGWEIGVHASHDSFNDQEMLTAQKRALEKALEKTVHGVRQHFINFESPLTWELQEKAGFLYDTTLASNERPGFRTGFCHPYRPEGLNILEIPLIVMDGQLFWYEKLDEAAAYERTMRILRTVSKHNGVACLNWHQHTWDEYSFPGWWDVFKRVLAGVIAMKPWFVRGIDLARWWNRRSRMELEESSATHGEGSWRLIDPEGGPATIRIVQPGDQNTRISVKGLDQYTTTDRDGAMWVRFDNVPAGAPVEVTLGAAA